MWSDVSHPLIHLIQRTGRKDRLNPGYLVGGLVPWEQFSVNSASFGLDLDSDLGLGLQFAVFSSKAWNTIFL